MNKSHIALLFICLVEGTAAGAIIPLIPILIEVMDINNLQVGYIVGAYSLGQVLFAIPLGILSDYVGRKRIIYISLFVMSVSYALMSIVSSYELFLLLRFIGGIGGAGSGVLIACIVDYSGTKEMKRSLSGLGGAAFGAGFILGPALSGALTFNNSYSYPLMAGSLLMFVGSLISFIMIEDQQSKETRKIKLPVKAIYKETIGSGYILAHYVLYLVTIASLVGMESFIVIHTAQYVDWSPSQNGLLFAFYSIIFTTCEVLNIKYFPSTKRLIVSLSIYAVLIPLIYYAHNSISIIIIISIIAVFISAIFPYINGTLSIEAPDSARGFVFGISITSATIGAAIGPMIYGYITDVYGSQYAWLFGGIMMLLPITLIIINQDKKRSNYTV